MNSKELLHELIHSLTKSEKRYFSVFTSIHKEGNNYVKLFNAIQSQKEYDEGKLLVIFKNEEFVRQFSVAKNYLMNLILKSLSNHHQKAKKSIELNTFLTEIEILFRKGLYKLSHKRVKQAKKIAQKYDMTHYLLLINHWDRRLEDYVSEKILSEDVVIETQQYLKSYNLQMEMRMLIKQMERISKGTIKRTEETVEQVEKVFEHELMQLDENEIDNFTTKLDYYFMKGIGHTFLGDKEKEFYYKNRTLQYLEENPHQIKENPIRYASSVNNMLLYYYFQGFNKEFPEYLKKLDQVELKFDHTKTSFMDTKHNLQIGYYLHLRDTKKVTDALAEMEAWYKAKMTNKSVVGKMICEYNLALAYYYLDDTKNCLKWSNTCFAMFDMKAKKYRHDLAISIIILQALIYFDLKHYELAQRNIEMVFSIASKNKYGKAEMSIFKLLKKMIKNGEIAGYPEKMKEIIKSQGVAVINLDKDIMTFWLEKKIPNLS